MLQLTGSRSSLVCIQASAFIHSFIQAMTRCQYLNEIFPTFKAELRPFKGHPDAGRDQQGYGRKIPTDYAIRIGSRWYRVYVCCFSNAGTAYINVKGHPFLVVTDGDLSSVRDCN